MERPFLFKPNLQRLARHLEQVSKERNCETTPGTLAAVEAYLREEFRSYGLGVHEEPFSFLGQTFSNLIARIDSEANRPRLIIGAHFDSVAGSPGADDNASGIAALLEAARIYAGRRKAARPSPAVAVEFAAFNLEEYGMVGSHAYARKLKEERREILGMISLEMVGYISQEAGSQKMPFFLKPFYPDTGNFIGLVGNGKSKRFLTEVEKIFRAVGGLPVETLTLPGKGWVFPEARLSDHSPFWDEGLPALLVTDTSFFRNPHYHSSADRLETLNLDFLAKVTEAVVRTVFYFEGRQTGQGQIERR